MPIVNLQELKELIRKYNAGLLSVEERKSVEKWYESIQADDFLFTDEKHRDQVRQQLWEVLDNKLALQSAERRNIPFIKRSRLWIQWAAVLILVMGGVVLFYLNKPDDQSSGNKKTGLAAEQVIKPGGNKAMLTLADGSVIVLNEKENGILTRQEGTAVSKTEDGQLVYNASLNPSADKSALTAAQNTISTPRGGDFKVILPDGTKVWLNAASSLTFPVNFTGSERRVELKGEAYFEVAANKEKPFIVKVNDVGIKVLGTHFNVMAYQDEPAIETTLLEGAVQVSKGNEIKKLLPGQQAQISEKQFTVRSNVNTDEIIAWKNGLFQFYHEDVQSVMRKISRWYDVEINYEGQLPVKQLTGKVSRQIGINELLSMLAYSGINFETKGNKINVISEN